MVIKSMLHESSSWINMQKKEAPHSMKLQKPLVKYIYRERFKWGNSRKRGIKELV